jgi:ABC-type sugar transport system substrate-binding protein
MLNTRKSTHAVIIICILLALSDCCFGQAEPSPKRVGVLLLRQADPFYLRLASALRQRSTSAKLDFMIVDAESSTTSNGDLVSQRTARQEEQLHRLIMEGVDALVLVPASDPQEAATLPSNDGIAFYTQTARRAGIPVFTLDLVCKSCGTSVLAHVTSDNRRGGALAGRILVHRIHAPAEIVVLTPLDSGYSTVKERIAGFDAYMSVHKKLTVLRYSVDGRREKAHDVMLLALKEHPQLRGIFAINDETALGALDALEEKEKKDVKLVGFDGNPDAIERIHSRTRTPFCATIQQNTDQLAKRIVDQIGLYFRRPQEQKDQLSRQRKIVVRVTPYPDLSKACK